MQRKANSKRLIWIIALGGVAVLGLVLTEEKKPESTTNSPPLVEQKPETTPVSETSTGEIAARPLPAVNLDDVIENNPFDVARVFQQDQPTEPEKPKADAEPEAPEPLNLPKVELTYNGPSGPAAIVGGKIVSVGDPVGDGFVVTAITEKGVVIERVKFASRAN